MNVQFFKYDLCSDAIGIKTSDPGEIEMIFSILELEYQIQEGFELTVEKAIDNSFTQWVLLNRGDVYEFSSISENDFEKIINMTK